VKPLKKLKKWLKDLIKRIKKFFKRWTPPPKAADDFRVEIEDG